MRTASSSSCSTTSASWPTAPLGRSRAPRRSPAVTWARCTRSRRPRPPRASRPSCSRRWPPFTRPWPCGPWPRRRRRTSARRPISRTCCAGSRPSRGGSLLPVAERPERLQERRVAITSVVRYSRATEISGCLRILDLGRGRLSFVTPSPESTFRQADPNPRGGTRGTRGISAYGDRLVVANAERLFVFDTAWNLVAELSNELMADVHDVLAEERGNWATATGIDQLLLVGWDGTLEHAWTFRKDRKLLKDLGFDRRSLPRAEPALDLRDPRLRGSGYDRLHLNSLGRSSTGILLSFGRVRTNEELNAEFSSALLRATENGAGNPDVDVLHVRAG